MSEEEEDLIIRMHKLLGNRSVSMLLSENSMQVLILQYYLSIQGLTFMCYLYISMSSLPEYTIYQLYTACSWWLGRMHPLLPLWFSISYSSEKKKKAHDQAMVKYLSMYN